jgi:hypothetical protein
MIRWSMLRGEPVCAEAEFLVVCVQVLERVSSRACWCVFDCLFSECLCVCVL